MLGVAGGVGMVWLFAQMLRSVMALEARAGYRSTFFFVPEAGSPDRDPPYELDTPRLRDLLGTRLAAGRTCQMGHDDDAVVRQFAEPDHPAFHPYCSAEPAAPTRSLATIPCRAGTEPMHPVEARRATMPTLRRHAERPADAN